VVTEVTKHDMKESFKNYIGDLRDVLLALADNLDLKSERLLANALVAS